MTARGPPNEGARQQQGGEGWWWLGGTRVSRDGDDLMGTKIKTKKKTRTSNKKPKKIPGPKINWPQKS